MPPDQDTLHDRLQAGIGDASAYEMRLAIVHIFAASFTEAGAAMVADATQETPPKEDVFAFGLLLVMAGDLLASTLRLSAAGHFYSAAALIRQIVEIEYLTWAFKENHVTPSAWLNSTHKGRQNIFSPRELRKTSKGRFLDKDYRDHCEQGGHPVPKGMILFQSTSPASYQILVVDLITHSWRTWDQVREWAEKSSSVYSHVQKAGSRLGPALLQWGAKDDIYKVMCEHWPEDSESS